MRMSNAVLLTPRAPVEPEITRWATVTQASPLRIKLDGESTALPFTPETLVAELNVNDRVRVSFPTNSSSAFLARRVIVVGRAGGIPTDGILTAMVAGDAITNAKLANMTQKTIKGRNTASTGDPEDIAYGTLNLERMGCTLRRTSNQSIPNAGGGDTAISWSVEDFDSSSMWSSGSTVTIPAAGIWTISLQTEWEAVLGTGRAFQGILDSTGAIYRLPIYGLNEQFVAFSWTMPIAASVTFTARVYQSSGAALNLTTARLHVYRTGI